MVAWTRVLFLVVTLACTIHNPGKLIGGILEFVTSYPDTRVAGAGTKTKNHWDYGGMDRAKCMYTALYALSGSLPFITLISSFHI